uniref:Uncharacterized protein n=1 Tax=Rhizophora mucronata TaxID=61149 RepID=A0A2P2P8Y7_RHIMU
MPIHQKRLVVLFVIKHPLADPQLVPFLI